MYGFYIQWSKVIQHATTSNEGNPKPRFFQNYVKRLDMEKHPFILIYLIYLLLSFNKSVKVLWIKKKIYNTIQRNLKFIFFKSPLKSVINYEAAWMGLNLYD
jgi:hypothetical protein